MYEVGQLVKMINPMLIDIQNGLESGTRITVERSHRGDYGFYTTVGDNHDYYILNHQVREVNE